MIGLNTSLMQAMPAPSSGAGPVMRASDSAGTSRPETSLNLGPRDRVELSDAARSAPEKSRSSSGFGDDLTKEEREQVQKLKERDREVRAHEQAHQRVGGQYASAPSYEYQTGPDGNQYAVGGEVAIDASAVPGDPEATIAKMKVVKNAALAPAEPSAQDRKVAAQADATAQKAQAEKREMDRAEREAEANGEPPPDQAGGLGPIEPVEPRSPAPGADPAPSPGVRAYTAVSTASNGADAGGLLALFA